MRNSILNTGFTWKRPFYEGESTPAAVTAPGTVTVTNSGQMFTAPTDLEIPPNLKNLTTFTQHQMNEIFAHNKKTLKTQNQEMVQRLEQMQQSQNLTQQQRDDLQKEIDQLKSTYETKDQQYQQQLTAEKDRYNKDIKATTKDRDAWKGRFETSTIKVDIAKAAEKYKAFKTSQIEAILLPLTECIEQVQDGKPTGIFVSQVNFTSKDKEGKAINLKLSPEEAVKAMTEMPEEYGNLFENSAVPGANLNPVPGSNGKPLNIENMSIGDYKKNRATILSRTR